MPRSAIAARTRAAETMVSWGVRHVLGMVGHSSLGALVDRKRAMPPSRAGSQDPWRRPGAT
jgi:hypothetical protein